MHASPLLSYAPFTESNELITVSTLDLFALLMS